jgi:phospholipid/cholesterol/gamma-HCH transport system permease protein
MGFFEQFGNYLILIGRAFHRPLNTKYFRKQLVDEIMSIGVNSIGIVFIISIFMGAVLVIQAGYNIENPLIPAFTIAYGVKESLILEFSPTIVCLILAGKIGSSVASQIGTMRVMEQIDALEIMGVNSANFLILPKIVAAVITFPILILQSMIVGMFGGYIAALTWRVVSHDAFIEGLNYTFIPYEIFYALVKTIVFSFLIVSIASFYGYNTKGGAVEVGKSSTKAVVYSSIAILLFNLILTRILLGA